MSSRAENPTPSHSEAIRLLHVASPERAGGWLAEVLANEGVDRDAVDEANSFAATLARLRETPINAVLVSHEPSLLDAVTLVEGVRVASPEVAVVVLLDEPSADLQLVCYEAGADAVVIATHATARSLAGEIRRAVEHRRVLRENRLLLEADRQRLAAEHHDAAQTLADQRRLVEQLEAIHQQTPTNEHSTPDQTLAPIASDLPVEFASQHRDLMRAYVIMGAGNLTREIDTLAERLAATGVSAERVIQMHLVALEELLTGLGRRSARHVINRADLMVLELVAKLADGYRRRYDERNSPVEPMTLSGFELAHGSAADPIPFTSPAKPAKPAKPAAAA